MNKIIIILLFSFSLVGCATFGPKEGSPEFSATVNIAVKPLTVVVAQSASWLPNTFGYNNIMAGEVPIAGAFVLTQNEVMFLVWNEGSSAFIRATSIQRADINQAIVDSFGRGRRLVLVSKDKVNSFELTSSSQNFVDTEGTDKIAIILNHKDPK
jgi:hypothetical protein